MALCYVMLFIYFKYRFILLFRTVVKITYCVDNVDLKVSSLSTRLVSYRNGDDQSVEIREHFANLNEIIVEAKEIQQDVERLEASGILDHVSKGSTP